MIIKKSLQTGVIALLVLVNTSCSSGDIALVPTTFPTPSESPDPYTAVPLTATLVSTALPTPLQPISVQV